MSTDPQRRAEDERNMQLAISEALRGRYTAHPNPIVGAVIVRDGRVIGRGFHARAGEAHAERNAIANATEDVRGATMYVTLEPCSHHGRTPPCTEGIIEAGIGRVVAGCIDPNPRVSGSGIATLRAAGVDVEVGVLGDACWALNLDFVVHIRERRPLVMAKLATSLDGRIATRTGESKWITGPASRRRVHELRRDHHAILVGKNTLLADDPSLTTRLEDQPDARSAHRYVLDARLEVPDGAKVLDVTAAPTTIVCGPDASAERRAALIARGVEVLEVPRGPTGLDVTAVLAAIAARGYISVLVEGGGALVGSLMDAGLIDRMAVFTAPVVLGGAGAVPSVGGEGVADMASAPRAHRMTVERLGDDVLMLADLSPHLARPGAVDPDSAGH